MHAAVRGERLLGVKPPSSSPAPPTVSSVVIVNCNTAQTGHSSSEPQSFDKGDGESGAKSDSDNQNKPVKASTFNAAFSALIILSLFMNIPISLIGPFFPNEAMRHGVSLTACGFILSSFPLSVVLSAPLWGYSVPFLGPKILIIGGGIITGACVACFALIDNLHGSLFIYFGMCVRFFQGIGCAATETGATAMLAGRFPDSIGTVTGLMDVAESLGFMIGPLFGGMLYEHGGFQAPFLAIGGLTLALMIPLMWLVPTRTQRFQEFSDVSVMEVIKTPGITLVILAAVMGMSVFAYLELALQPHFIGTNITASKLGLLFTLMSAVYAICSPVVGWATSPRNTRPFIVLGLTLIACALCLLSGSLPLKGLQFQVLSLILISAGCSLVLVPVVPSMTFAVLHLGNHALGVVSGIITSSFSLGEVCGPAIGGYLMQRYGFQLGTVLYASILLLVAAALLVYIVTASPDRVWTMPAEEGASLFEPLIDPDQQIFVHPDR